MSNTHTIYQQLADFIQGKRETNEYNFGAKIPSEREFSEIFKISRMTVRKAIDLLIEKGLLVRIQGKGTFVSKPKIDSPIDTIQSMKSFIQESGLIPSNKVLIAQKEKAGIKYSKIFHINPDDDIFLLFRLRLGNGEPIALEYTYIPYQRIPNIESYDCKQCSFASDCQHLEIVKVCSPQSTLLKLAEDSAVFMLLDTVTDTTGQVIEYTRSYVGENTFTFSSILT